MGWDGWMGWGWTVHQKGPLIFYILRYIKHYTYTNIYIMGEFQNRVPKMRQKYVKKTLFNIEIIPA